MHGQRLEILGKQGLEACTQCRQVACGARHSCALTLSGSLYTWGCNLHHQCGVDCPSGVNVPVPTLVLALGGLKVTCVAAGLHHTIVSTDAGERCTPLLPCCRKGRIHCWRACIAVSWRRGAQLLMERLTGSCLDRLPTENAGSQRALLGWQCLKQSTSGDDQQERHSLGCFC